MQRGERHYWFPAKTRGWGWGPPVCWQGWLVLVVYFALLIAGAVRFLPGGELNFLLYAVVLTLVLVAVVAAKGERPVRWRSGK